MLLHRGLASSKILLLYLVFCSRMNWSRMGSPSHEFGITCSCCKANRNDPVELAADVPHSSPMCKQRMISEIPHKHLNVSPRFDNSSTRTSEKESIFNIDNLNIALANRMFFFDLSTWNPVYFMSFGARTSALTMFYCGFCYSLQPNAGAVSWRSVDQIRQFPNLIFLAIFYHPNFFFGTNYEQS